MALEDDVRHAIEQRMKISPTSLTSTVHGPVGVPPEKVAVFAELQRTRDRLLELAREFDELVERF